MLKILKKKFTTTKTTTKTKMNIVTKKRKLNLNLNLKEEVEEVLKEEEEEIEEIKGIKCNICYEYKKSIEIIECFHGCTINTCIDCLAHQLSINKIKIVHATTNTKIYKISYKCSQCQQEVRYFPNNDNPKKIMTPQDKIFSRKCHSNVKILNTMLNKFINTDRKQMIIQAYDNYEIFQNVLNTPSASPDYPINNLLVPSPIVAVRYPTPPSPSDLPIPIFSRVLSNVLSESESESELDMEIEEILDF